MYVTSEEHKFLKLLFQSSCEGRRKNETHMENSRCTRWYKNPNKILCYLFLS